jgi:hypothetical protein
MKTAIIVLSDPKGGSEESLGRVFNALASAYEFKINKDEVTILFQGAGSRWPSELVKPEHPVHGLFAEVKDKVAGISAGCANVFGAADDAKENGFRLIRDSAVPGTDGLPSLRGLAEQGYTILTF